MQNFGSELAGSEPLTDMSQFPGDKAGPMASRTRRVQADSQALS
jgi:hypothetical protein